MIGAVLDRDQIKDRARHHWPEILSQLGLNVGTSGEHGPCPACAGTDRFRFDDIDGEGTWFCNQCNPQAGDGIALVMKLCRVDFPDALGAIADALNFSAFAPKASTSK